MKTIYKVSGNNLFGQWFLNEPILENFKIVSINDNLQHDSLIVNDDARLTNIFWSNNIFQCQNGFYVSGAWDDEEQVLKKLGIFSGYELKGSYLLAAGNDNFFCVVDGKQSKIWTLQSEFGKKSKFCHCDSDFDHLLNNQDKDTEIVKVVSSNKSIYFLNNKGYIFHGIPPSHFDTSYCLGAIIDIACGYEHFILLTDFGRVYTWGSGKRFQLGHGAIEDMDKPQEVEALAGLRITKIAAGGYHCIALSEFGDAYAWGWNDVGQLGVVDSDEFYPSTDKPIHYSIPKLIDICDEKMEPVTADIVDIACGSKHTALKLADNTVWSSGNNKYGQLGLPSKEFPSVQRFKNVYESNVDFKLMCGLWSTVIESVQVTVNNLAT